MTEPITKILVPLDGSTESELMLAAMMPIVRYAPVDIRLLNVVPSVDEFAAGRAYLDKACKSIGAQAIPVDMKILIGDPAAQILEYAAEERFDLIAMATHGRNGLRRVLVGSVAEEVIRRSQVPVLAYRPGAKIGDWKQIVVALDGSERGEEILPDAVHLARMFKGLLHLVRAADPMIGVSGIPDFAPEDPAPYLRSICNLLGGRDNVAAVPVPRSGAANQEITKYAAEIGAGLICLTTHGRTGLGRALMGSVAEEVLRNAPCPVLVRRILKQGKPREPRTKIRHGEPMC